MPREPLAAGEGVDHRHPNRCRQALVPGQDRKRQGLEGVAGQDGGGLVEGLVAGQAPPAQVVVVHGREVVVDQRIGVDQLDGAGGAVHHLGCQADGAGGGVDQGRPDAFARPEGGVAHGRVQPGRLHVRRRQAALEGRLAASLALGEEGAQVGVSHAGRRARVRPPPRCW